MPSLGLGGHKNVALCAHPGASNALGSPHSVTRKRDIKQFRQACKEVGLTAQERYAASEALHTEKDSSGVREHLSYGELLAWLRQWRRR